MSDRSPSDPSQPPTEDFIRSRPAEGMLLTPDGGRVTALPETLLQILHRTLDEATGSNPRLLLYRAGYEWGLQDMLQLSTRMRTESGLTHPRDLWQRDAPSVLARWSAPVAASGWGASIFDLSAHGQGIAVVELRHSVAAAAVGRAPLPVCHLYAGLFAGALSFYDRVESHAVETECAAMGLPCCRFIVGPGPLIDQAERARHAGVRHEGILRLVLDAKQESPPLPPTSLAPATTPPAMAAKIPWKK